MADRSYEPTTSMVLKQDRIRRDAEPTGRPESLYGKIDPKEMGTRAAREAAPLATFTGHALRSRAVNSRTVETLSRNKKGVLDASEEFAGLVYRPRTTETRIVYEMILAFVRELLGDQPFDILRGATDDALAVVKDELLKDLEKKAAVEDILGKIELDTFTRLVNLTRKLTDYPDTTMTAEATSAMSAQAEEGIAINLEEEEEEENERIVEVVDEEEEEEDQENLADIVVAPSSQAAGTLNERDIDAFYLQRLLSEYYQDSTVASEMAEKVFGVLEQLPNPRQLENSLVSLLNFDKFELVKHLIMNHLSILWCIRLSRSASLEERRAIEYEMMRRPETAEILRRSTEAGIAAAQNESLKMARGMEVDIKSELKTEAPSLDVEPEVGVKMLDLESLAFPHGSHTMTNKRCLLPEGSFKRTKPGYEEIHIPAPISKAMGPNERLVPISTLPEWAQPAFEGLATLNRIQSRVKETMLGSNENVLLCAPTGAGKTNVALLAMLREIGKHIRSDGVVDLDAFRLVYVAPMKALVQEMVTSFTKRLAPFGVNVAELTGDASLTGAQLAETQLIVTTPEKWDVVTRKVNSPTNVTLIILDEVHLLHDERGPVLESIVARTLRRAEETQKAVRLVGLSATLPNYNDVASFLRVDPEKGLFHFDGSFRPCPLAQQYVGLMEKKPVKRIALMNEVAYEKAAEQAGKNQVLVFVHSRKDTIKTAKAIRDFAISKGTIGTFLRGGSRDELHQASSECKNNDLKELLTYGFAIHHAGLSRPDRSIVESAFASGHVQLLVSTATLAWGVNLPAHTVIIKGTQVYRPEMGRWAELSPQDVLQMLGRAGRPQFDTHGDGIIITTHSELQFYLSLLNTQLPIESQLISKLPDLMNAEVVLGSIGNRRDAVEWLGYSYLYVRMLRAPGVYGIDPDSMSSDPVLRRRRADLVHAAANVLDKAGLVRYDRATGTICSTELGRIASHYYISSTSIGTYARHLKPSMDEIDLFRVFSLSQEFKLIPVRAEEKQELQKLLEQVPIPIKESVEDPAAKINVLLQAYISNLRLEGFALMSDMTYITQSAGRLARALFEMCLRRGWARSARKALSLSLMVSRRAWLTASALRQIPTLSNDLVTKVERRDFPWERMFDLNPQELGELVRNPRDGKILHTALKSFPRFELQARIAPISRSLLRIDLTATPTFEWDAEIHGGAELFHVLVEDVDGEQLLYIDTLRLTKQSASDDHHMTFTVPLVEPLPPFYFLSVVADRWLHSETKLAVSFCNLLLPTKSTHVTELLDLQPLLPSAFKNESFERIYANSRFNAVQTQAFPALFRSDENVVVCAPAGNELDVCAEFAIARMLISNPHGRAIFITPSQDALERVKSKWQLLFEHLIPSGRSIVALGGDVAQDLKLLESGTIIFATPSHWDLLSRRWKQRKNVQTVSVFIVGDIHMIGSKDGPTIEVIVSRMRYISSTLEEQGHKIRIIACGDPIANARDLGDWIGASKDTVFNFDLSARSVPLQVTVNSQLALNYSSFVESLTRPAHLAARDMAKKGPTIAYTASRKQAKTTAVELATLAVADANADGSSKLLNYSLDQIEAIMSHIEDPALGETIRQGIAFYHEAMSASDQKLVRELFESKAISMAVVSKDALQMFTPKAMQVIVLGTQCYDGREHRYIDYPLFDILCMLGRAGRQGIDGLASATIFCPATRRAFYQSVLSEPLPVESHLDQVLHDHFNAEIAAKTIGSKQAAVDYLTWTFLYRRLAQNPNYYGIAGVSQRQISDYLSELVESTVAALEAAGCIAIEEEIEVASLNLGMIGAYYNVAFRTIEIFASSLSMTTKLRGILEIVSTATEFEDIPIRHGEDVLLQKIYDRCPVKLGNVKWNLPQVKTNVLLQAHFSRIPLPSDLEVDLQFVLATIPSLIYACVDVISSNGWLSPAISAMEFSQMCAQRIWDYESSLKQIPGMTVEMLKLCKEQGIESVYDIVDMQPQARQSILGDISASSGAYEFVDTYPTIDVELGSFSTTVDAGETVSIAFKLERVGRQGRPEGWWLVIGEPAAKSLLAIKRLTNLTNTGLTSNLELVAPESPGEHNLKAYLMSDCYLGCDQEFDILISVAAPMVG